MSQEVSKAGNKIFLATAVTATTTAGPISSTLCNSAILQNGDATNNLLIGDATSQPFVVTPGNSLSVEVYNLAEIYLKSSSATVVANILYTRSNG